MTFIETLERLERQALDNLELAKELNKQLDEALALIRGEER